MAALPAPVETCSERVEHKAGDSKTQLIVRGGMASSQQQP